MFEKQVWRALRRIEQKVDLVIVQGELILATIDEQLNILAIAVTAIPDSEDALIRMYGGVIDVLKTQLAAALAGALTPAQQAKVDVILAAAKSASDKMAAATFANTPAEPAGPVVPAGTAAPVVP